jgi:hypothetical protein
MKAKRISSNSTLEDLPSWSERELKPISSTGMLDTGAESTVANIECARAAMPESLTSLADNPVIALSATNHVDEIQLLGQLDVEERIPPALLSKTITETLISGKQLVAEPYGYDLVFPSKKRNLPYGCLVVEYPSGKVVFVGDHDFVIDYSAPSPTTKIAPMVLPTRITSKNVHSLKRVDATRADEALLAAAAVLLSEEVRSQKLHDGVESDSKRFLWQNAESGDCASGSDVSE